LNILFVVPYVPDLVRVRPYNLIRNLTAHGHKVTVATLWSTNAERIAVDRLRGYCHQVIAEHTNRWQTIFSCLSSLPTSKPIQSAYAWQPKLADQLSSLINRSNCDLDVVHVEHLRGSRYGISLKAIINSENKKIPIIWDSVDCISFLFRQAYKKNRNSVNRFITYFETNRTYRYEKWLLSQFDNILVTSEIDKNAFESMLGSSDASPAILVVPNGVDLDYFHPGETEAREPITLVLSGKMSYHANVAMAMHLVNDILPIVWSQNPEVKLCIVGKDPPDSIRRLALHSQIHVTGTVDDIRPYLQSATIAVAPITYGAGIQNKVLEAMACGTPVVATSQAVSALSIHPGRDALIENEPRKFAQAILEILSKPDLQHSIGQAGRRYVEKNHRWADITSRLESIYNQVIARSSYLS
jgi:sugar transferase (PEP-CTERM/EpsH1 system associated)